MGAGTRRAPGALADGAGTDRRGTDGCDVDGRGADGRGTDGRGADGRGADGRGTDGRGIVGYAPGAWDLFHVGHLNVLRHAASRCDRLVAGVVDDDVLERVKGRRPVVPVLERAEILRGLRCVDEVVVETQPDKLLTWREHPFDLFFKGDDWRGTPAGTDLERRFAEVGVEVVYFPYTMHTSSTQLRRALSLLEPAGALASLRAE